MHRNSINKCWVLSTWQHHFLRFGLYSKYSCFSCLLLKLKKSQRKLLNVKICLPYIKMIIYFNMRFVTLWCLLLFFIIFVFCWMFSLSFRSPLICYVLLLISSNWVISWRFSIKWILRSSEEGGCDFGPVALLQASCWPPDQTVLCFWIFRLIIGLVWNVVEM